MRSNKIYYLAITFVLLLFCVNNLFAQDNNGTEITGDDAGWDDEVTDSVNTIIKPILFESDISAVFDLTGKKIETDDITTLPPGIYICNGKKFIVQ